MHTNYPKTKTKTTKNTTDYYVYITGVARNGKKNKTKPKIPKPRRYKNSPEISKNAQENFQQKIWNDNNNNNKTNKIVGKLYSRRKRTRSAVNSIQTVSLWKRTGNWNRKSNVVWCAHWWCYKHAFAGALFLFFFCYWWWCVLLLLLLIVAHNGAKRNLKRMVDRRNERMNGKKKRKTFDERNKRNFLMSSAVVFTICICALHSMCATSCTQTNMWILWRAASSSSDFYFVICTYVRFRSLKFITFTYTLIHIKYPPQNWPQNSQERESIQPSWSKSTNTLETCFVNWKRNVVLPVHARSRVRAHAVNCLLLYIHMARISVEALYRTESHTNTLVLEKKLWMWSVQMC